jgi:hypothetical protein
VPAPPEGRQFGLPPASALVVGSVIGSDLGALRAAMAIARHAPGHRAEVHRTGL